MSENTFHAGEYFIYVPANQVSARFEIGKVKCEAKQLNKYFCYYSSGATASLTDAKYMHKIVNAHVIEKWAR